MADELEFLCNVCGALCRCPVAQLTREDKSCSKCHSNVRIRSLLRILSLELFQVTLPVAEFPRLKSVRGLGLSDIPQYAVALAEKFDYRNTFYDRAPRFDLMRPPESELGQYDFVMVSDVLEHVPSPVEDALRNIRLLLRRGGVAIMTVPYSVEPAPTSEHFPELNQFAVTDVGGRAVLVNRTVDGRLQVFENLIFHHGLSPALEMREFSETSFRQLLAGAGFDTVRWHGDSYEPYGIVWREPWSLPLSLRQGPPSFGADTMHELMTELGATRKRAGQHKTELELLHQRRWLKLGRALGIFKTT